MLGRAIHRSSKTISRVCSICRRDLHVCIVGSGPAGFYTADRLLKTSDEIKVDMLERLPSPFGLVRSGVAPDHPETKTVINQFTKIASSSRLFFFGNVHVGKDITVEELRNLYDVVVLAYGAESDNHLGIEGEGLPGVFSAREFVWWYNGHPDCANLPIDLQSTDTAIVLGQGNVAIDVARILLRPFQELNATDIADHALESLKLSKIRKVYLVGRRGPAQIACTAKELRELLGLKTINIMIKQSDLITTDQDEDEMKASRIHRRVYDLLCKAAQPKSSVSISGSNKELHFVFYRQPVKFFPSEDKHGVGGVQLEKTHLQTQVGSGRQQAVGTGIMEDLPGGLVLKSVGYKSLPLEGLTFDSKRGVVPNVCGRVLRQPINDNDPQFEPGFYVVGWLKRGPTGIIGTNLVCAEEVVASISEDIKGKMVSSHRSRTGNIGLQELLITRGIQFITFRDWQKINAFEVEQGEKKGKPREKLIKLQEVLQIAFSS
ncbi:hypothetical protein KP509_05G062400 [Ceratopteris richardii]|uniref:NADPH:adrenodoxin oxidoreductase, mitochondrial n=1 Tax=Ceratopteris richardii TaxID=49495 RepID=A0A8T2UTN8_CERRI|nr:hypothetical protein KP509_05G062400 [Ceratopteris richardii]KAH7437257.1 hypothetical protein KP509_05G062400 [Ceratopteris richardii]KAH7437258.1 hypothetical protein KP509_05G062400 [Ceratopteris richardii]